MRNATTVLPFKTRRPTSRHYFLHLNFRPFSFFIFTRAKINPASICSAYLASESDASAEITHHQRITCHDCLLSFRSTVNNRLWKFKDRLRNNSSFTSINTTT